MSQFFTDVALSVGLNMALEPEFGTNGIAVADIDHDGDLDIYFVARSTFRINDQRTWNRLFKNRGDGTFTNITTSSIAGRDADIYSSYLGKKFGASWGDYDNDGYPDLFLTNAGPNQLFHNSGNGTFNEVTDLDSLGGGTNQVSTSALWFDYDVDGDLDLYVGVWEDYSPDSIRNLRNQMFENLSGGRFNEVSLASGLADSGRTWMTVPLDANNDGWPDLYLANDFGANKLYINNGDKTFTEKTAEYGLTDNRDGMGLAVADCDNNGYFDIYLTNITQRNSETKTNPLFLNLGNGHFINKAFQAGVIYAGWGWGTEFFDYDNDKDEDLFAVNGYIIPAENNVFYENISQDTLLFDEAASRLKLADIEVGRSIAVFDYNSDGRQDILISNYNRRPFLYKNNVTAGNWLKINLEGTVSNRNAFGTVVKFKLQNQWFYKYYHGAQFLGQNIVPLHLGAGEAHVIDSIQINWPNGAENVLTSVMTNQHITIKENIGIISTLPVNDSQESILPITLMGNYPNPFNGMTVIKFILSQAGTVNFKVYDSLGRQLLSAGRTYNSAGEKSIKWYPANTKGVPVSSGIYFYSIECPEISTQYGRMLHIK